jgi:hypothetical protein
MTRPLDDADAAARQVERRRLHQPGCSAVSPPTSAQPPRDSRPRRPDELGDAVGIERARPPRSRGTRAARRRADDVVGAHRDEVDADRVEPAERRAIAVFVPTPSVEATAAARGSRPGSRSRPEPAEAADDLGPAGGLDVLAHQLDGRSPGATSTPAAVGVAARHRSCRRRRRRRRRLFEHELAAARVVRHGLRVVPSKQAKQNRSYGRSSAARTPRIDR